MKIISVNIAETKKLTVAKKEIKTGIYKESVTTPVLLTREGFIGDNICNRKYHGGADQAVYVYGQRDYDWWQEQLGKNLEPGTFGENLTVSDLESASFSAGDRLELDKVVLEVTAPRLPCATFATKMDDPAFVKKFKEAGRPGFYCRVIREGYLKTGYPVAVKKYNGPRVSILEMFHDGFFPVKSEEQIRRFLNAPISARTRLKKEEMLKKMETAKNKGL